MWLALLKLGALKMAQLPDNIRLIEDQLRLLQRTRAFYSLVSILVVAFTIFTGVSVANSYNAGSFANGIDNFFDYPLDLISEAWDAGWQWFPLIFVYTPDLLNTLNMAVFSTSLGFVFALILSFLAAKNTAPNERIRQIVRRFLDLCRSFPELVIAMIFLYIMGKSLLPAILAITIHSTGSLGKLFSEAIENADKKPVEGLQSLGANWFIRVRHGVLTQVLPIILSYTLLRVEINVRASTILGFVGAGGIGEALSTNIQWRYGDEVVAIMVMLVATIICLDYLSQYVRGKMIVGQSTTSGDDRFLSGFNFIKRFRQ
tara:strand:- start:461 stop:1408 length:948 start_codon:yes stop_codon:yes gene_type:complete